MKKIKIAHVQVLPILSGVQNISLDILRSLDDEMYDKFLVCADDTIESSDFSERFEQAGVTIIRLKYLKREIGKHDVAAFNEMYQLFKVSQFDIVHSHSTKPGIIARIAARFAGVKAVIHSIHGVAFHKNEPLLKRALFYGVEFMATLFGHYLTSVSQYYRQFYPFVRDNRFKIIYNGIDIESLTNQTDSLQEQNKAKVILFLSRLERAKDPLTLLKAVLMLKKHYQRSDFIVKIAGDGELMAQCVSFVEENNLTEQVEFLGWITDKAPIYQKADIFCVPSIFEAFGLVFAEAGLYQLPTVSTNVEGIPEVVIDGETGLLVSPQQPELLAEKLNELLIDSQKCNKMGQEAKKRVLSKFTTSRMVDEYQQLYLLALTRN